MFSKAVVLDFFSILLLIFACLIGWFDIPATLFYIGTEVIVYSICISVLYAITKRAERIANILPVTAFITIVVFLCASTPAILSETYDTKGVRFFSAIPDYLIDMIMVTWPLIFVKLIFVISQLKKANEIKKELEGQMFENMIVSLFTSIGIALICLAFFSAQASTQTGIILTCLIIARLLAFFYLNKKELFKIFRNKKA